MAWIAIDDDDVEHWRIGTGAHSLRLDVSSGTLLGGPTPLQFDLLGLARIRPQLKPLDELIALSSGSLVELPAMNEARAERWILELRTADALAAGAGQRDIARSLLGQKVPNANWRGENDSIRSRTRRLIRSTRGRLANPLATLWFK